MEVRALLGLMRENETQVQQKAAVGVKLLQHVRSHLAILDPVIGKKKLIKVVATEMARLRAFSSDLM
jgi:hypothetical protein